MIPSLNQINRMALGEEPHYPDDHEEKNWMILFPEDHHGYGSDAEGNVAVLLDEDNAREVKRLAEQIIERVEEADASE
jgi:hypothetical protein